MLRIIESRDSESVLEIDGNAFPAAPKVSELAETGDSHIALDGILRCPDAGRGGPLPAEEILTGGLEHLRRETEDVGIDRSQGTTGIVDDILGIVTSLGEIILVQTSGNAGLSQIDLRKKTLSRVIVNAVVLSDVRILGKELHGFLEGHDDIFVNVGLLDLVLLVVARLFDDLSVVMDDGNITEGTDKEEVSHGFPCEGLAYRLVLGGLAGLGVSITDVVDDSVALRVDGPKGIGHILEVLVSAVHRQG